MTNFATHRYSIKIGDMDDPATASVNTFDSVVADVLPSLEYIRAPADSTPQARVVTISLVAFNHTIKHQLLLDWLHDHHARGGTYEELVALYQQHEHRARQLDNVVACGTVLQDPTSSYPKVERRHGSIRLKLSAITASWPAGTYFLVAFDHDNPSSV